MNLYEYLRSRSFIDLGSRSLRFNIFKFEPPHDKTNKMACAPTEDSDQPGHRPVWSESSLCAQWIAKDLSFLHADSEDWSDWADVQTDLSLRWAHMPLYWFCHEAAHFFSLETAWPIEAKFYVEPPLDGGTKVWSNGLGHMTKMAAMPIYGKNSKSHLLRNQKVDDLEKFVCCTGYSSAAMFIQIMTLGWHCPIPQQGQIW